MPGQISFLGWIHLLKFLFLGVGWGVLDGPKQLGRGHVP